jgi:SAM-dependent methyltransferase
MSMAFAGLDILLPVLQALGRKPESRLLFLGTQDLAFTYEQARAFMQGKGIPVVEVPPVERRTTDSFAHVPHGDWWQYRDFIHQETLIRMLGYRPEQLFTMDVDDYEHAGIIHDLNQPLPPGLGQFDLILNQGTLEHIFDIRQALWNLSDLTRVGGHVIHMVPAAFLNHGFYNFNALLFGDYYRQSGWHEEKLFYLVTPKVPLTGQEVYARVPPDLLIDVPSGCHVNVFGWFRKTETTTNPIAVQGLYLGLHEAWDHQSRDMSTHIRPEGALLLQPGWWERARRRFRQALALHCLRRLPGGDVITVRRPDDAPDLR